MHLCIVRPLEVRFGDLDAHHDSRIDTDIHLRLAQSFFNDSMESLQRAFHNLDARTLAENGIVRLSWWRIGSGGQ